MTDRPIRFSGPEVRAILEGRKTVTRRPIKTPAKNMQREGVEVIKRRPPGDPWYGDHVWSMRGPTGVWGDYTDEKFRGLCPYGVPGDRLWVGETHWADRGCAPDDYPKIHYRADMAEHDYCGADVCPTPNGISRHPGPWTRSSHMPRWASRITLEVTSVTVERVQDITNEDAIREGATSRLDDYGRKYWQLDWSRLGALSKYARGSAVKGRDKAPLTVSDIGLGTPRHAFGHAWIAQYGQRALDDNQWVWRIEFRRFGQ